MPVVVPLAKPPSPSVSSHSERSDTSDIARKVIREKIKCTSTLHSAEGSTMVSPVLSTPRAFEVPKYNCKAFHVFHDPCILTDVQTCLALRCLVRGGLRERLNIMDFFCSISQPTSLVILL